MSLLTSYSPLDTLEIAREWTRELKAPSLILMEGPLGAGKTHFVKGIALSLGIEEEITSPTYSIVNEYEAPLPLIHMDLYRLHGDEDFENMGGLEYLNKNSIVVVEWPGKAPESLSSANFRVQITISEENTRRILLEELI